MSGCGTFVKPLPLPEPPAYLAECEAEPATALPEGDMPDGGASRALTAEILAAIRSSELGKMRCASGWRGFYEALAATRKSRANQP